MCSILSARTSFVILSVLSLLLLGQPFCYTVLATETTTTSTTSQRSNAYFLNKKNKSEHYVTAVVVESSEFQSQQEQEQQPQPIDTNELVDNERTIESSLKHSRRIRRRRRRISSHMEMSDDVDEDEQHDEDNTNEDGTVDDMEDMMMMSNHVTNLSTGGTIVLLFVCGIICFWLTYLCLQKYDTQKDAPSHECDDDDDDDLPNNCKVQNDSTMLALDDIDTKSNTTNETTIERYHSSTKTNDIL